MALLLPSAQFGALKLGIIEQAPSHIVRVTRFPDTEPYFGRTRSHRFDDPEGRFGVCYAGDDFLVAFAESVLHDCLPAQRPDAPSYVLAKADLKSLHVVRFIGAPLSLADLTGAPLNRLGGDNSISSIVPYDVPQRWSKAVHQHRLKPDGLRYVSRKYNTGMAFAIFDRVASRFECADSMPLLKHPRFAEAREQFDIALL
jgi:hypothetical protein